MQPAQQQPHDATEQPSMWVVTTPRKSSIARMSMRLKTLPAYLMYVTENGTQQRFDCTKPSMKIGRKEGNDIVLQCPQISKHHGSIEKTDIGYSIVDNHSSNGIQVNGADIEGERYLKEGDQIQLGSVVLEFHDEQEVNPFNWHEVASSHPAFAGHLDEREPASLSTNELIRSKGKAARSMATPLPAKPSFVMPTPEARRATVKKRSSLRQSLNSPGPSRLHSSHTRSQSQSDDHTGLVTILPSETKYEETITVRAELKSPDLDLDFAPADNIEDPAVLRQDYEKLRLAYELSKLGLADASELLQKTLELMFSVLPVVDRGVILLRDRKTGILTIDKVKLRKGQEHREILLSSTILRKVYETKSCLITADAFEDPNLGKSESICRGRIRSVICVPLVAHDVVHGILHLDSQDRLNSFAEKDLALVKAISNQTAIALENAKLLQDIEKEASIREALGRFLPPHVVDRCVSSGEEPIRKGGRQTNGTILFADIRGFTAMSEKSSPQEVVELLNDFFERLVQIVFKYDGVLDKYIGDCLMAAFGTLPDQKDAEYKACCAALEFKIAISEMNLDRMRQGKEPLSIGVGLNTGNLVAGYIGSSQRLEYTSIGDTVNTASRICSMALDNEVLISESTYEIVKDRIDSRFHAKKVFKGKTTETNVYEAIEVLNE